MSNELPISFPLNSKEYEMLWLHLTREERTGKYGWHSEKMPEDRNEQTMQLIKTCCMIDMTNEKIASLADIHRNTLYNWKKDYGERSKALCALMEKRGNRVEVLAKSSMLWLLAKWHAQTVIDVVKTKDKRYREADNEAMQSLAQFLWLVKATSEEASDFIIERQWTSPSQDTQTKTLPEQSSL